MSAPAVSGIRAWYSFQALTGLADNDQITSLTDLSGNEFHGTGVAGSGGLKPQYDAGNGILFQSLNAGSQGGYFTLPAGVFTGLTSATLYTIFKPTVAQTTLLHLGAADSPHQPFDNDFYENFCCDSRWTCTVGATVNNWQRYRVKKPAGAGISNMTLNGVDKGNSPARNFAIPVVRKYGGGPAYNFGGLSTALLIIDHDTTPAEDTILETWGVANPLGGLAQYQDQEVTQSNTDYEDAWLTSVGQPRSVGSIRDREMAFLRGYTGAPVNKDFISFNDLQKFYGKTIRDNLWPKDW